MQAEIGSLDLVTHYLFLDEPGLDISSRAFLFGFRSSKMEFAVEEVSVLEQSLRFAKRDGTS